MLKILKNYKLKSWKYKSLYLISKTLMLRKFYPLNVEILNGIHVYEVLPIRVPLVLTWELFWKKKWSVKNYLQKST